MVDSLPRWPAPLSDEHVALHDAYAADVLDQFVAAAALAPEQVSRLKMSLAELNRRVGEGFDQSIASSVRTNRSPSEEEKLRFFEVLTSACEDADRQIAALAPGVADRTGFVAMSQLNAATAQKLMTFYARSVEGTSEDQRVRRGFENAEDDGDS